MQSITGVDSDHLVKLEGLRVGRISLGFSNRVGFWSWIDANQTEFFVDSLAYRSWDFLKTILVIGVIHLWGACNRGQTDMLVLLQVPAIMSFAGADRSREIRMQTAYFVQQLCQTRYSVWRMHAKLIIISSFYFSMDIFCLIVTSLRIILFTSVANSVQTIFWTLIA